ncbi:MAG TPA: hypothetical protein VGH28_28890 [Polyangiaceae bacterium]|jgi:hypothetical protein
MRWLAWGFAIAALGPLACVGDDSTGVDSGAPDAAAETAPAGFCATHTSATTLLCADFDGPSLDAGWTDTVVVGGGALSLESTDAVSAPNALVAKLPSSATPTSAMLRLDPVGAPAAFSGALRLEVKVPACFQGNDLLTIASLQFFASSTITYQIDLQISVNGSVAIFVQNEAESGINGQQFGANQLLPLNAWTDMELDLTTSGTPHANLVQGGQVVLSADLLPGTASGAPRFLLGASADKLTSATCSVELDDVTLDRQ